MYDDIILRKEHPVLAWRGDEDGALDDQGILACVGRMGCQPRIRIQDDLAVVVPIKPDGVEAAPTVLEARRAFLQFQLEVRYEI